MIITAQHLAVILAALEYWDEEMSPHDPAVYVAYFSEPIGDGNWVKTTVAELRAKLPRCHLRYLYCSADTGVVITPQFVALPEELANIEHSEAAVVATAIISPANTA